MAFKPKIGLISCSGEACSGGMLSRAATLEVLHHLRPTDTVTICLPLFLAGDGGEREFARNFPTITVDGCSRLCAAKGTAKYSSEPAVRIDVTDYTGEDCTSTDEKKRIQSDNDLIRKVAQDLAAQVDRLREEWE